MAADLPADALAVAFAHLDVSALLACTAVCADWRRVARARALDRARAEREAYWAAMRLRVRSDAYHLRHLAMAARADTCAIPRYVCAACGAGVAELVLARRHAGSVFGDHALAAYERGLRGWL